MEHSLKLLTDYLQNILKQPEAASLQAEDLSPEFRELGEKISLLASTVQDLTNQLQQKAEALEMENQVLMDNIQAMDEISWALEQSNQQLRINLNLVNALTDYTHNMIFVYSAETGQEVHTNQPARWFQKAHALTAAQLARKLLDEQPEIQREIDQNRDDQEQILSELQSDQNQEALTSELSGRHTELHNETLASETFQQQSDQNRKAQTSELSERRAELHNEPLASETFQQQSDLRSENRESAPELSGRQQGPPAEGPGHPTRSTDSHTWNMVLKDSDGTDIFYQVESFLIPWLHSDAENSQDARKQAIVHIVLDETERQRRQNMIYRYAYVDPLTNLNNRRYATEKMEQWQHEGTAFLLSFIDVDYLKYCNDTFGHEQGDSYLLEVANALQTLGGEACRVGGDEFFLLQTGLTPEQQDEKLEKLRQAMLADKCSGYPKCFSFATTLIPADSVTPITEYISETDTKMYQYKQKYKIPLADVLYKDDRI